MFSIKVKLYASRKKWSDPALQKVSNDKNTIIEHLNDVKLDQIYDVIAIYDSEENSYDIIFQR